MRTHHKIEIWLVLGLSLGQSAVYAIVSLATKLARGPLEKSQATLNPNRSDLAWLDFTLNALTITFALVPVALALYLLSRDHDAPPLFERIGLAKNRPLVDVAAGFGLAVIIGIPGLLVYVLGKRFGLTVDLVLAPENLYAWSVAFLVLAAIQNALLEEVIAIGYLLTRLREAGWNAWAMILASAALRGTYHLYQGPGQALGNFLMGIVFGWWYVRTGRLWPLIVAHAVIDIVAFVGYALLPDLVQKL